MTVWATTHDISLPEIIRKELEKTCALCSYQNNILSQTT